ncbi:hypothetical protein KEM48_004855 [Puccinia striiformis f. sp. tritici PST-130]|nr:hypothetical protein KEM48_004855 [Puccinia striiformis f. sp. tritici PST-130]
MLQSHPNGLELIQAIGIASRWLWSFSRPSGWLPNGSGAHPGHQDGFPMALELIQAIRMASQWLWSSSRPSGWLPNGSGAHPGHRNCIPTAWKQIFEWVRIFEPKNGGSILRIESNRIRILESIRFEVLCLEYMRW